MEEKNINLPLIIDKDEDNIWFTSSPILKGFNTQWENLEELQENVEDLLGMYFQMIKDWEKPYSGKYFINLNVDKNGQITNNFFQEIDKNFKKELIWV